MFYTLLYCIFNTGKFIFKSKAPVSQLVNADVNSRVTVLKAFFFLQSVKIVETNIKMNIKCKLTALQVELLFVVLWLDHFCI